MKNTRNRYKPGPLQVWRVEYAYISRQLTEMKRASRANENWGSYKVPRTQSLLPFMKGAATQLMSERVLAATTARLLWEANRKDAIR